MASKAERYIYKATIVSLCCNVALVLIKSTALILVNSLAIAVDLGISFVGLTVSVILYFSMKMANKPADLYHNYGYGKIEHVCETLEGVVLIGIALAMSSQAILSIFHPKSIHMPWIGFASCAINVMINFGGASYIFLMAKKSASPAIHAEGMHWRLEGFISSIIAGSFLVSIFLRHQGLGNIATYVDPAAALLVSVVVIIPSFKLAHRSFFKLLDASMEEGGQIEIIKQLSKHLDKFCEFTDLKTRTAGRRKFVEFKLVVPEDISFKKGYEIVSFLENDIIENIPNCEPTILLQPCDKDCAFVKSNKPCPYLDP